MSWLTGAGAAGAGAGGVGAGMTTLGGTGAMPAASPYSVAGGNQLPASIEGLNTPQGYDFMQHVGGQRPALPPTQLAPPGQAKPIPGLQMPGMAAQGPQQQASPWHFDSTGALAFRMG